MKIKTVSKTLGLTLAAIASVSMAACSRTPLPDPGASGVFTDFTMKQSPAD